MRIILQARTTSSRFPGKALLPVKGMPAAALAALRAGNRGGEVVLATSSDPEDEALAQFAASLGLRVLRGPADDVLQRYLTAAAELADDAVIVRLTGDNLLPDGHFAEFLAQALEAEGADIVGTRWPESGLPYGMFGEAFRAGALRAAAAAAPSDHERRHVTPWLWRHRRGRVLRDFGLARDLSDRRCALTSFEDYLQLQRLFAETDDPIHPSWRDLLAILARTAPPAAGILARRAAQAKRPCEFVLGTAQIGMAYGSVRPTAMPSYADATELIRKAAAAGVRQFDTARAYQHSEYRLGAGLPPDRAADVIVITKLDPLARVSADAPGWAVEAAIEASVFASCRALNRQHLPILLLHRLQHRSAFNGVAWRRLLELRSEGVIGRLGASVQSPREALEALAEPEIEQIQLPFNLLDRRWREAGVLAALADRADVIVHARSVFLQGVLLREAAFWPSRPGFDPRPLIARLGTLVESLERRNLADLCLAYVRSQAWVDGIVIGVETEAQLRENLDLFREPELSGAALAEIESTLAAAPDWLLDPAVW